MTKEYCLDKVFKTDISELCNDCDLKEYIEDGIKNQIVFKAETNKDILTDSQFNDYVAKEVEEAQSIMSEILNFRKTGGCLNIRNLSEVYIWNKERIKALNRILNESDTKNHLQSDYLTASSIKTVLTLDEETYLADLMKQYVNSRNSKIEHPEFYNIIEKTVVEKAQKEFLLIKEGIERDTILLKENEESKKCYFQDKLNSIMLGKGYSHYRNTFLDNNKSWLCLVCFGYYNEDESWITYLETDFAKENDCLSKASILAKNQMLCNIWVKFETTKILYEYYKSKLSKPKLNTIKGFKTTLTPEQQKQLYKALQGNYIDCSESDFLMALSGKIVSDNYTKIHWLESEPLFCCLIYGFEGFKGIGEKGKYKKAIDLFSFRTKTTNKTLSSTYTKTTDFSKVDDLSNLKTLLDTVLKPVSK